MRTIFIPIFQGQQSRNILKTGVFKKLRQEPDLRLVIFTKPEKVAYYQKEYGGDRVAIVGVEFPVTSKSEQRFQNLCLIAIDSDTIKLRQLRAYYENRKYFSYLVKRAVTKLIGRSTLLQNILRWIDQRFFYDDTLESFFEEYKPDLVFCPNVLGRFDLHFLRVAKKRGVKTVGMVNSWDNLSSRGLIRSLPNQLLVHNEEIKEDAVSFQGFLVELITVCGLPHFDYYLTDQRSDRQVFYKRIGVSQDKKIILFCPAGSRMNKTEWQVVKGLDQAIKSGEIDFPAHILIRQPPNSEMVVGELEEGENVTFDRISNKFKTHDPNDWEWQDEDMVHLADSLFHSAMVINYASTMSIDAAAFDKPVISIAFDGLEQLGSVESFSWFYYKTTHYKRLLKLGGVRLAYDLPSLVNIINDYYAKPELDQEGRKKIVERQIRCNDGKASERVVASILNSLEN